MHQSAAGSAAGSVLSIDRYAAELHCNGNPTSNGIRHHVTFSRLYKEGDEWKYNDSLGRDDLLVLAKVADLAHSWICELAHQNREADAMPAGKKPA